jgi:uncharacterized protein (TIGR00106 family)
VSTLIEFSVFPTDKGESVSRYVSEVIAMIRDRGVDYRLTPMGTVVETETVGEALALVEAACGLLAAAGCNRVYASVKLDVRRGRDARLQGKVASVEDKIGPVAT